MQAEDTLQRLPLDFAGEIGEPEAASPGSDGKMRPLGISSLNLTTADAHWFALLLRQASAGFVFAVCVGFDRLIS